MDNKKNENFSEWYTEILQKAELADIRYNVKGFVVVRPWAVMTMEYMYDIYEKELQDRGHQPVWFPIVIPESNFTLEASHVEGFTPEVFWITEHGKGEKLEEKLALRPTSETALYKMYSLWIQGLVDLPLKIYQRASVYRYETKATRPFIRSREFFWIEAHDCFATKKEAVKQVKEDVETTEKIMHGEFCIPFICFQRPEWDKFAGAVNTYAADTLMPDGKIIQQPSTHLLGQNFSKPFNITFQNENGEKDFVWQTCYGPAISRIYASLISCLGDDQGLRLPFKLAPVQVIVVPIYKEENKKEVLKYSNKIKKYLSKDYRVKIDDSSNTPGYKFNEWEMKGVPIRLEIGGREQENNQVTVSVRTSKEKQTINLIKLKKYIKLQSKEITETLKKEADENFDNKIHDAKTLEQLKQEIDKGGFVRVPFCSIDMKGKECAEIIKAETSGDVRGVKFYNPEKPDKNEVCICCGKPAKHIVYIGKQY